jgi:hypothetical protein
VSPINVLLLLETTTAAVPFDMRDANDDPATTTTTIITTTTTPNRGAERCGKRIGGGMPRWWWWCCRRYDHCYDLPILSARPETQQRDHQERHEKHVLRMDVDRAVCFTITTAGRRASVAENKGMKITTVPKQNTE